MQIERATTHTLFGDVINPANTRCSFTLESFQENSPVTQIIYCGHIFNPTSLSRWWEESVRCPLCRYDIRNHNGTSTINNRYSLGYRDIGDETNNNVETNNNEEIRQDELKEFNNNYLCKVV